MSARLRNRRLSVLGVSAVLALTVVMADGGQALAAQNGHGRFAGSRPANAAGTVAALTPADAIDRVGRSVEYASVYGGMKVLTDDESRIEVYLTMLDPAVEDAFVSAGGFSVKLIFTEVSNSLRTVLSLQSQLTRNADSLRAQGVDLVSYGPDQATGKLQIAVTTITPKVTELLSDLLGAPDIEIGQQRPIQTTAAKAATAQRALFRHRWHVKRVQRASTGHTRVVHLRSPMAATWSHLDSGGAAAVEMGACTSAAVTITGRRQTFGTFTTAVKTGCGSANSAAADNFIYGDLLAGTVTWHVTGPKLILAHPGVGRMVLVIVR